MASRKGLRAVLFDLDGTLVNLHVDWDSLNEALRKHFSKYGIEFPYGPLLDSLDKVHSIMEEAFLIMRQFEIDGLKEATICEGALQVLT